ncbi:hypothetical protein, partial [Pseudomonas syringae group genomosp. 7]|uniref:hypothetical protein n=1 Tax=Pseudomonas syringae group genomosp. 7 TaxID=251699 RepID=UPI00377071F6
FVFLVVCVGFGLLFCGVLGCWCGLWFGVCWGGFLCGGFGGCGVWGGVCVGGVCGLGIVVWVCGDDYDM